MPNDTILKVLADNPALFEAVKAILLAKFSVDHLKSDAPNELLGEQVKVRLLGIEFIEEAFSEIARLKSAPIKPAQINQAR